MKRLLRSPSRAFLFLGLVLLLLRLAVAVPMAEDEPAAPAAEDGAAAEPREEAPGPVLWTTFQGTIGTVSASYLEDAVHEANRIDASCLVIELDTPGGLDTSMRTIVKAILSSDAPVILYVSPSGSRATSAGVFIAQACHVIAMAPGTNMGAAHPVNLAGGSDSTMTEKATNDAVAYIRSIAEEKGRNADWAEEAVRRSVSVAAHEAVEKGVADLIAEDRADLLEKTDGRAVVTAGGERVIRTEGAEVREFPMSKRYRLLSILNDPNAAYLLLLLGFYGIFFELSSPGSIYPGVIGAISLVLGLYALQSFSINYAGLLLMVLGVVFFIAELLTPTYGVLSAGGVASLLIGSLLLFRDTEPFYRVSLAVIVPAVAFSAAFFIFAVAMAVRTARRRPAVGRRALVGASGEARTDIAPSGKVFLDGAHWTAESDEPIEAGERVVVEEVRGMTLRVRKAGPVRKED